MNNVLFIRDKRFVFSKDVSDIQDKFDLLFVTLTLLGCQIEECCYESSSQIRYDFVRDGEEKLTVMFAYNDDMSFIRVEFYHGGGFDDSYGIRDINLACKKLDKFIEAI